MAQVAHLNRVRAWVTVAARVISILLLLALALWAIRLLAPGVQSVEYQEVPLGQSGLPQVAHIYYQPYPGAVGYVGFAVLAALGLIVRKWLPLAWLGILLLTGWSSMWLFSSGAAALPVAGVLVILLLILTFVWQRPHPVE